MSARLIVVYDDGAVRPIEIYSALRNIATLVFVVTDSPHVQTQIPVMQALGRVVGPSSQSSDLVEILRAFKPDGIVTYSERCLTLTARLAWALGLNYYEPEVLRNLTDKFQQRQRLRAAGVDATPSLEANSPSALRSAVRELGLPVVVKPGRSGGGSRHTYKVSTMDELEAVIPQVRDEEALVVEPVLQGRTVGSVGDYVSVESATYNGRVTHFAVTGKLPLIEPFRETGQFWPARLDPLTFEQVTTLVTRSIDALGLVNGVSHTEVKLTSAGPRIIEVNGRLGGHIEELRIRTRATSAVRIAAEIGLGRHVAADVATPNGVVWQHNNPAPRRPCRLVSISGVERVLEHPAVATYRPYVTDGQRLEGGVQTQMIDILCGRSATHSEMVSDISAALGPLRFTLAFGEEERRVSASDLPRL